MAFATRLLVADDLTGAADCAAYAPGVGLPATIQLGPLPMILSQGLQAFSTNSRALGPDDARRALQRALYFWQGYPAARFFKKIDSLLRGNVGAEIEVILTVLDAPAALVCPALPVQGRSVVNRQLTGAPNIAGTIGVADTLAAQSTLPQAHIDLAVVQGPRSGLKAALAAAAARAPLVTADAQSDADLDALVVAWRAAVPNGLLCGSAGLAAAWLRAHAPKHPSTAHAQEGVPPIDLVVVGSASAMAHAQIEMAAALPGVQVLEVTGGVLPAVVPGGCVLLHLPMPPGAPAAAASTAATEALAYAAQVVIDGAPIHHLLVTGGDTAQALLPLLGIARLDVVEARQPGMPTCRAMRRPRDPDMPPWVTLKAGNHGDRDTIANLVQR